MRVVMLAAALVTLAAWSACDDVLPGVPAAEPAWLDAPASLAAEWRADDALPDITAPRCVDALASLDVRVATEAEWIADLRLCPMTPAGCSRLAGCGGVCTTGTAYYMAGAWRVYLSPGEDAGGHVLTARHETAHVLSWCTSGALDYAHSTPRVWALVEAI